MDGRKSIKISTKSLETLGRTNALLIIQNGSIVYENNEYTDIKSGTIV